MAFAGRHPRSGSGAEVSAPPRAIPAPTSPLRWCDAPLTGAKGRKKLAGGGGSATGRPQYTSEPLMHRGEGSHSRGGSDATDVTLGSGREEDMLFSLSPEAITAGKRRSAWKKTTAAESPQGMRSLAREGGSIVERSMQEAAARGSGAFHVPRSRSTRGNRAQDPGRNLVQDHGRVGLDGAGIYGEDADEDYGWGLLLHARSLQQAA